MTGSFLLQANDPPEHPAQNKGWQHYEKKTGNVIDDTAYFVSTL